MRAHLVAQHSAERSEAAQFVSAAPWWTYCSSFKGAETGRELYYLSDAVSVLSRNCHFKSDH